MIQHKYLCVFQLDPKEGSDHRVPIDCVTVRELWATIDQLRADLANTRTIERGLKTRLYDLEHKENEL